jgi:hypothetical protein
MNTTENTKKYNENLNSITIREYMNLWRKAVNDTRTKPILVEHKYGEHTYKTKEKGWILPEHHIMLNVLRNLRLDRGFKADSDGYKKALHNLTHLYYYGTEKNLFKPFEESMDFEKFKSVLTEIRQLLKTK